MSTDISAATSSWIDTVRARCAQNEQLAKAMPESAEEARSRRIEAVRDRSEIPAKFGSAALVDFARDEAMHKALDAAKATVASDFRTAGPGVYGGVGTGKTRLLCAIANAAIMAEHRAIVITTTELLLRLKATFGRRDESEYALLQKLIHTPVLALDDLGKEQITEWSSQALFEFVNARYNAGLKLVVAANMSLRELWDKKYSAAPEGVDPNLMLSVIDKIREMTGEWILVEGKSKRRSSAR